LLWCIVKTNKNDIDSIGRNKLQTFILIVFKNKLKLTLKNSIGKIINKQINIHVSYIIRFGQFPNSDMPW